MVALNYFGNFEWQQPLPNGGSANNNTSSQVDKNGVFYATGRAFDRTGAYVWDGLTNTNLADGVDAYFGSAVVNRQFIGGFLQVTPILQGNYLIAYFSTGATSPIQLFDKWWCILAVPAAGSFNSLQVLGAVRYRTLLGVPYTLYVSAMIMNDQTIGDPLLILGNTNIGGFGQLFALLPSISAFLAGTYNGGYGGAYTNPGEIPYVTYKPVGVSGGDISTFFTNASLDSNNGQANSSMFAGVFAMPGPGSTTNIYQYLNRGRMDFEAITHPMGNQNCPEIQNVIAPAHPFGTMLKFNIPNTDYATASASALTQTPDNQRGYPAASVGYAIDGAAWGMPFLDEYTYISNGVSGGHDAYQPPHAINIQLPSGEWYVAFIMPGIDDATTNLIFTFPNTALHVVLQQMKAIRGYIYDPVAGAPSTAFPIVTGTAYTRDNLSPFSPAVVTWNEVFDPVQTGPDAYSVHIYGATSAGQDLIAWRTQLFSLFRGGVTIKPWVWVNS